MQQENPTSAPSWKIGNGEGQMIEMAAGDVGVVGQQDVARFETVGTEMSDLCLHGFRHAADEHRQAEADRDRVAVLGEQADGEVQRLIDDHVVGGAHEVDLHLLGHRHDAVAHDLDQNRIGGVLDGYSCACSCNRNDEIADRVDFNAVARQHDRGRGMLFDQRGPFDAVACKQRGARVSRRIDEAGVPGKRLYGCRCGRLAAASRRPPRCAPASALRRRR